MHLAKRAIKNFPTTEIAPRALARSNQRKWLKAVGVLGDKWLLAKKVERREVQRGVLA